MSRGSQGVVHIQGETYLSLERIGECYECEISWLMEAYEFGLLGDGFDYGGVLVLHVTVLDRVADVVRLSRYQGLRFEAIVVLLGEDDTAPGRQEP